MRTTVIVPCHNQLRYTRQLLDTMAALTPPDQLVVIDNGSTDGTAEYLEEKRRDFPLARLVAFPANTGFSRAMNEGIFHATGDCIIFLSNDVKIVTTDWLEEIRRTVIAYPDALIGAQMIVDNELTRVRGGYPIPYLAGWVIACSRTVVEQLSFGGQFWDERFFAYYEDVDLSTRALGAGLTLKTLDDLGLLHYGGKTAFSLSNQSTILRRSRRLYAEKWGVEFEPFEGLGE